MKPAALLPRLVFAVIALGIWLVVSSLSWGLMAGLPSDAVNAWSYAEGVVLFAGEPSMRRDLLICGLVPGAVLGALCFYATRTPTRVFGTARWATRRDVAAQKLGAQKGILLGRYGGRFLCDDEPGHVLLVAPTRSGKGVGYVVPNLLNWDGSAVVLDVKQENHRITAGFRAANGQAVFMWAPMSRRSARYNPLDLVSDDPDFRITDLQVIANMLVPVSDKDPMWGQEAQSLFVALALLTIEHPKLDATLGEVYRQLTADGDLREAFRAILDADLSLSAPCRAQMANYANKAPKEASGVKSSLTASLGLFANPMIDAATCASDFDPRDFRRRRVTVYVGVTPDKLRTVQPLLALFFQQVINVMAAEEPGGDEPHELLMMLDEFASLGNLSSVMTAFTLLAGYKVRVFAVVQGIAWLDHNYGSDLREGLMGNCAVQIYHGSNDVGTQSYVSENLGYRTVITTSMSRPLSPLTTGNRTKTQSMTGRPLITPDEVRTLSRDKAIVLKESGYPVLATKVRHYADKAFKPRLLDPPELPTLRRISAAAAAPLDLTEAGDFPARPDAKLGTSASTPDGDVERLPPPEHQASDDNGGRAPRSLRDEADEVLERRKQADPDRFAAVERALAAMNDDDLEALKREQLEADEPIEEPREAERPRDFSPAPCGVSVDTTGRRQDASEPLGFSDLLAYAPE